MSAAFTPHPGSYRDPSGFIFEKDGVIYRQVNKIFQNQFEPFISSGLYEKLVASRLLVTHSVVNNNLTGDSNWYLTLRPEPINFISFAYEWCFDMFKDAALLTLQLVKESIAAGFILKDATPYNIQWLDGRLIFIDTLSFEKYNEAEPWVAYHQFCESFLGPLLLIHYSKNQLPQLQLAWPNGIPLPVVASLLPWRTKFSLHTYLHIHLHARVGGQSNNKPALQSTFSKQKLLNLISSLEILIRKLHLPLHKSEWSNYYEEASLRNDYLGKKKEIVKEWIIAGNFKTAIDLGANDGEFSKLLAGENVSVISTDFDPWCINNLYNDVKTSGEKNILPLIVDLSNPTPAVGVNNNERESFITRTKSDCSFALALIHHLAIGKNIPFEKIAFFFQQLSPQLIIEFVPKSDEKVQLMLSQKKDIYTDYDQANFEKAFSKYYTVVKKQPVADSGRILYQLQRHEA